MKFTCSQNDLLSAIQTVQKISGKTLSPIYQYIYLKTENNAVTVVGTSQDETIITEIDANIEEEGTVLVPSLIIKEMISKLPSVIISVDVNDKYIMTVKYTNMKYNIQCMNADSFDFLNTIIEDQSFRINTKKFKEAIRQTYFTAALQDVRPLLSGIFIKCEHGDTEFVSTDSTRLSIKKVKIDTDICFDIIIPAKFTYDIINSCSDSNENEYTTISFNKQLIKITSGRTTSIYGLISGKFVNYQSIMPTSVGTSMIYDKANFLQIMERAFLLSDNDFYAVKFDIEYSRLFVSSESTSGEGFEEIQVKTEGNPLTIAFNSKNFIEILRNIDTNTILFEFTTGTRVCKITPIEENDITYLIFPLRI